MKIINILILSLFLSGCAATAQDKDGVLILKCLGSCEAELEDGKSIKKGFVTMPSSIKVNP